MKKFFLVALLGFVSLFANANQRVYINNTLPPCPGMTVTIQFVAYQEGTCIYDISSPVYPLVTGAVYDLCDPSTWAPSVLWMPSYETFAAIICVQCPGMLTPFCLNQIGLDCDPAHACIPLAVAPTPFPGCCFPQIGGECVPGTHGGCMDLNIHK
jgi:hypothetical protein